MANYYGTARTNYFKVNPKKRRAFNAWCKKFDLEIIKGTGLMVGLLPGNYTDDGTFPTYDPDAPEGEQDFWFAERLSTFLADGSVAIIMEAGSEKHRYVHGSAEAINNKGESVTVSLQDIYDKAKHLGEATECQY